MFGFGKRTRRRKNSPPTTIAAEKLETRQLLTGNVTAVVDNGNLILGGDTDDNQFEVTFFDGDVSVRTRGGTTVNGETERFVAFPDTNVIPGNLVISAGAGNDSVIISRDLVVSGQLTFRGGAGNDTFGILGATVEGNFRAVAGSGADGIAISDATIGGSGILNGNNGRDLFAVTNTTIDGLIRVGQGGGDDGLSFNAVDAGSDVVIDTGIHDDAVGISGLDVTGALDLTTSLGDDIVQVIDSRVDMDAFFGLGADADSLSLGQSGNRNVFVGDFRTNGSGGDNTYDEQNNVFQGERIVERYDEGPVDLAALDQVLSQIAAVQDSVDELFLWREQDLSGTLSDSELSVSAYVTREATIDVEGSTTNDALIELDLDGDGAFDDGSTIADEFGDFSLPVSLVAGEQDISVRSTDALGVEQLLDFSIHRALGSITRFQTSLGVFHVELLDEDAPLTVANYQNYFDGDSNAVIHRSVDNFVIQGGGFEFADGQLGAIDTNPPVENEFNPDNSNLRGTLSTALLGGQPDSATNQWFINLQDNTFLDNAQHTVFGRVIAGGLDVVDAIAELPVFNLDGGVFGETPLRDFELFSDMLTGTLSLEAGSPTVTGTDTLFTEELSVGQVIQVREGDSIVNNYTVVAIASDTEFTLSDLATEDIAVAEAFSNDILSADHFVFSDLESILE